MSEIQSKKLLPWKKVKEEYKALKRQRKQEKLIRDAKKLQILKQLNQKDNELRKPPKPRPSTISIAVPGSILENTQSAELRAYVAGQVARAACIYRVNEIIVFDDVCMDTARETKRNFDTEDGAGNTTVRNSSLQLARILQYLECPQYLRKFFFPLHKDLKHAGLLNPLDAPHHLRRDSKFIYREGVVCDKKAKEGHSFVNVGLLNDVHINKALEPGVRVTVKMETQDETRKRQRGIAVSPDEPRRETGVYWGYSVRIAHSLSEIFTKSPYEDDYDLTVGTSDRGINIHEVPQKSLNYNHLLMVFGGLQGLEAALLNDEKLTVNDPSLIFDHYVNILPKQGTRTIRTEEALLIALAAVQEKLEAAVPDTESNLSELLPQSNNDTHIMLSRKELVEQVKKKTDEHRNNGHKNVDGGEVKDMEVQETTK